MHPLVSPLCMGSAALALSGCTQLAFDTQTLATAPLGASAPSRQLVFFHPHQQGVLNQCRNVHLSESYARVARVDPAEPGKAWVVQGPYRVTWQGGWFNQPESDRDPVEHRSQAWPPTDVCFAFVVQGHPVLSGAVVSEHSARLLDFPTLVRTRAGTSEAQSFELRPRFPGLPQDRTPAEWDALLKR